MEFKQLEAFVNVVKYKSFSKAAEATYLTQPTISTHISSLEKELGVKLVDRNGKESRPTKYGRAFYNYAINIINTRDRAVIAMTDQANEIAGAVDIKTSGIPGQFIVPEIIASFHQKYPKVTFNVEQSDSGKVWDDIQENLGDIGFTGYYANNNLKCCLLLSDHPVIITPRDEKFLALKKEKDKLSLDDLKGEEFIWREEGSATRKTFEDWFREHGHYELKSVATVNSIEAIKECVRNGMGISVMSKTAVRGEQECDGNLLVFELEDMTMEREFYMIYNRNTTLSPAAQKFREYVESKYLG